MSDLRHNAKPTLEELLRLKRAERPDAQFWAGFERELRQKQLTALVEKPRWWHGIGELVTRKAYLPVGAAAVVAFTLVTVRYNTPAQVRSVPSASSRMGAADPAIETLPATVVAVMDRHVEPVETPVPVAAVPREAAVPEVVEIAAGAEASPSARSIAANLASLEQAEPELLHAVLGNRLSAVRVQSATLENVPEPVVSAPAAPRYRLIARYADRALSPEPSAPALVRERLARRLGDDLVDDAGRFGVGGNRVSLKF